MSEAEKIIIRYESARQAVSELIKQREQLISKCKNYNGVDSELCLTAAYKEMVGLNEDNYPEGYSYDEVLHEGVAEGVYCQSCADSFALKHGPLSQARQEFGHAKRALSRAGKRLLKGIIEHE